RPTTNHSRQAIRASETWIKHTATHSNPGARCARGRETGSAATGLSRHRSHLRPGPLDVQAPRTQSFLSTRAVPWVLSPAARVDPRADADRDRTRHHRRVVPHALTRQASSTITNTLSAFC